MLNQNIEDFDQSEDDTQKDKYLTFTLGRDFFGLDIIYITEIIVLQQITSMPDFPIYMKGIINLRGKIIPVMDVRMKFKKEIREYDERTCIIVIDVGEITTGLIVDRVSEVLTISESNISPPPEPRKTFQDNYVKAIGKVREDANLILDCEKLISEENVKVLKAVPE